MKINIEIDEQKRHDDGLAEISIEVPHMGLSRQLDVSFAELFYHCRIPDEKVLDLLIVSSLAYVVDKTIPRSISFDFWTREFEIEFPVADPVIWKKASGTLEQTLNFLTGDTWKVSFRKRSTKLFVAPSRERKRKELPKKLEDVGAVCSLSGGTDSLTGAFDLIEKNDKGRIHLIGHYDAPGAKSAQNKLFEAIKSTCGAKASLTQVRVSHRPVKAKEATLRSRSLVFMAIGIFAARAAGPDIPVFMPENGFIAMNLPLTPARVGSCSTRTMHPYYLDSLRATLTALEIQNPIINPLEFKTKGECISETSNFGLLRTIIGETVSCSHGTRKQHWVRKTREIRNCGYCVPCIVRRAGMHKAGLDEGNAYGVDLCVGEIRVDDANYRANDLRAMISAVTQDKSEKDIRKEIMAVAPVDRLNERAKMIKRGLDEIRVFLKEKSSTKVRRSIGL